MGLTTELEITTIGKPMVSFIFTGLWHPNFEGLKPSFVRGQYITNPNNAVLLGNSLKMTIHLHSLIHLRWTRTVTWVQWIASPSHSHIPIYYTLEVERLFIERFFRKDDCFSKGSNQQFQGTICLMVFDFLGLHLLQMLRKKSNFSRTWWFNGDFFMVQSKTRILNKSKYNMGFYHIVIHQLNLFSHLWRKNFIYIHHI